MLSKLRNDLTTNEADNWQKINYNQSQLKIYASFIIYNFFISKFGVEANCT